MCNHGCKKRKKNKVFVKTFILTFHSLAFSFRHDRKLVDKYKPKGAEGSQLSEAKLPSQQFGASLEWIKKNQNQMIPPIMNVCMDFLSKPENLEVEGIFR